MSALEVAKKRFHKLDIAVNCAGIGVACKTYNFKKDAPHSLEDFMKVVSVSISGLLLYVLFYSLYNHFII